MTVIGVDVMSIFAVPDVYALICAARGDALIARQPCDGIDWLNMPNIGEEKRSREGLPDIDVSVIASRGPMPVH